MNDRRVPRAFRAIRAVIAGGAIAICGPIVLSAGQQPTAPAQVFRSGVDVVRLDVRVTDASGRPIPDLRADEISVIEDGVARPVLLFQRVAESGRSYFESVQRTVAAEVSTNQGAPRGQLYVLVFDQEHLTAGSESRIREAASTFLRTRVRPNDRVAVFGLPGPGPAQPLTANLKLALDQVQRVRGDLQRVPTSGRSDMRVHEAYEISRGNDQVLTRFLTATNGTLDRSGILPDATIARVGMDPAMMRTLIREYAENIVVEADASARRLLEYLAELLRTFRGIDGRKTVVLFSEGFHSDNVTREIERVASAAAETYSVIYAFDLNPRLDTVSEISLGADQSVEIASRLEPLGSLAHETNGELLLDASNRMPAALDALAASETDHYIVGFEASASAVADRGQYRRIDVRVTRPGARVSARTGYATGPTPTPADRRRAIDLAFAAPFSQQGLRLEYTTYVSQGEASSRQNVVLSLETELPFGRADQFADVAFAVRDMETGNVAASGSDRIALPIEQADSSRLGRTAWRVKFDLPAGSYLMRCVVREPGGLVGSADRHFVVRSLAGPDVAASDLMLGGAGEGFPVRAKAYTDVMLGGAMRVYARSRERLGDVTATIDLVPVSGAEKDPTAVRSVRGELSPVRDAQTGTTRDVSFTIPVNDLPPGEYVARAIVRAQGETVADLRRQVEVIRGTPPPATSARPSSSASSTRPRDVLAGAVARRLLTSAAATEHPAVRRAAEHASRGRWPDALTALTGVPAETPHAERLRALALLDQEDYTGASALLARELQAQPADAAVAFVLGWARVGAADDTGAVSAFRSAAWNEPTLVAAHLAIAETLLRLREPLLAIQALEAGVAKNPDAPELRSLLDAIRKKEGGPSSR